ncbi:MAG: vitamin B12-dependent ribonucleotide reductase [Candidatus Krumholzibacteriia bacterium]
MAVRKETPTLTDAPVATPSSSEARRSTRTSGTLRVTRRFTQPGVHPYEEVVWEKRTATIQNEKGEVIFEQSDVEIPATWSQMATNVVVSKYFHGQLGIPGRESSVKQLIDRVARTITRWGRQDEVFASDADAEVYEAELTSILLHQKASFNSPVWFNVGVEEKPQCSACFINSVDDTMHSILTLAKTEGMLFKYGSGTGTNFSALRSSKEKLSTGGKPSGPVSFMKGYDAFAGVIRSGGRTRRAAKMVILNADHPDIAEYIACKANEERKACSLIDAGYDGSFNGEAYASVFFQNSNNSVRVTDMFMRAVENDGEWTTHMVTTGEPCDTYRARDLMRSIAESAWVCGDPGMQFDSTVNNWNPCINSARINASNPCSEYMFLDDSACNLASINLMKFRREDGSFDVDAFNHTVDVMITAMEIFVGNSSYPTPAITRNSHEFRPLGLGYANLGAYLMSNGIPYDSERAFALAGAITALLCGRAYRRSAELAEVAGAFSHYHENRDCFLRVMHKHADAVAAIDRGPVDDELLRAAREAWSQAIEKGKRSGFRNAQATVLAPTGTIAFMMDCDTTGIEPDFALVKFKKLAGGGVFKIVNNTVPLALQKLGYTDAEVRGIVDYIDENDTIEGAPGLKEEHLPVFDCAFKPARGSRSIHYSGHLKMMAATQPFLSGAISKTVNMPHEATPDEVAEVYTQAWKMGLKSIAVYRDGCKRTQPLNTSLEDDSDRADAPKATRRRLPDERRAITHKFSIDGHEGYITVGMYPNGKPGEIFIVMAKSGSVVSGLMDSFATSTSIALQYGVPLEALVRKFVHLRFEPAGRTNNPQIPMAKSIMDYIFRWMALKFLPELADEVNSAHHAVESNGLSSTPSGSSHEPGGANGGTPAAGGAQPANPGTNGGNGHTAAARAELRSHEQRVFQHQSDAPPCSECGAIMVRNGACYKCLNCGITSGCG